MTIKLDEWQSKDGGATKVKDLDTRHLANAIAVVERNDPRYGVRHGVSYPALLKEMARRANAGDKEAIDHEIGAGRIARVDFETRPFFCPPYMFNVNGAQSGRVPLGLRVADLEYKMRGAPMVASIDDRAGRAHRRIDKLEAAARENERADKLTVSRVIALETRLGEAIATGDSHVDEFERRLRTLESKAGEPDFIFTDESDILTAEGRSALNTLIAKGKKANAKARAKKTANEGGTFTTKVAAMVAENKRTRAKAARARAAKRKAPRK